MTKTVEAWAVLNEGEDGTLQLFLDQFTIAATKRRAHFMAIPDGKIVPCTITYRLGDGDEG